MPLDASARRPAHILLASRSDIRATPAAVLWRQRRSLDGTVLRCLVLTDGPGPVEICRDADVLRLPAGPAVAGDSTGAGDFFAAGLIAALHRGAEMPAAVQAGQSSALRFLARRPGPLGSWMPDVACGNPG